MTQIKTEDLLDDEAGKLFVGGLSWETTQEKLKEYFSRYGEVVDCVVMKNNESGRSRGFGFVSYKDISCVAKVLSGGPHELDGRTIDPKVCSSRNSQKNKKGSNLPKVFLGGLPPNCTETDIRSFFSRYGTVIEVVLMYDQEKKKARGFGFLSFETEDSVKQVCAEHFVKINGKQVECKHAEPRDKNSRMQPNAPPQSQWGSGMPPGPGGWGPPPPPGPGGPPGGPMGPPGGPMGGPMNSGMIGGYQGGWGQQPGPYGPQGGWGPQQQGYGPGYQNWGGPGYGPYGGPGPNYAQGYGGYGPGYGGYGGYNGPPAPGGPPPAGEGYSGTGPAAASGPPSGPPSGPSGPPGGPSLVGVGAYSQENSNYGPTRGGYGGGGGGGTSGSGGGGYGSGGNWNGPGGNYNSGGNYGVQDNYRGVEPNTPSTARVGGGGGSQGYHPYRR